MTGVIYDYGTGGFAVAFTCPTLQYNEYVRVKTDSAFRYSDKNLATKSGVIELRGYGSYYQINIKDRLLTTINTWRGILPGTSLDILIVCHERFVSIYCNGNWIKTFWLEDVQHEEAPTVTVYGTSGIELTNVVYPELNDWRDAIYIDLEQTGMNAVHSVLQSKPVSVWNRYDGTINFAWDPAHPNMRVSYVRDYERSLQPNQAACSDAIVYFTDVVVTIDPDYIEEYGFSTRLIRIPDLDEGIRTGRKIQQEARKDMKQRGFSARFNPLFEFQDQADVDEVIGAIGLDINESIIIQKMQIVITATNNSMKLMGRLVE